jgi:hypothetical protein
MMESANELVDHRNFPEATKKLKNVEDAINFTLSQDIAEQVNIDINLVILRNSSFKIKSQTIVKVFVD